MTYKTWILIIMSAFLTMPLVAQTPYEITHSTITISGNSTLHEWTSVATETNIIDTISFDKVLDIQALTIIIPVKSIRSDKGYLMNNKTHQALKAKAYPIITFKVKSLKSIDIQPNYQDILLEGYLTIAGKEQPLTIMANSIVKANGTIAVCGSKLLKMSDFDVTPPTGLLGVVKTDNEIVIEFHFALNPKHSYSAYK